jgi:hypothetical protein
MRDVVRTVTRIFHKPKIQFSSACSTLNADVIRVSVSRNFKPLSSLKLLTRQDWAAVGRLAREQILKHTAAGRDEHGRPFRPYSPSYAAQKRQAGASGRVDLMVSGQMLGAITVTPDDKGVTLAFGS